MMNHLKVLRRARRRGYLVFTYRQLLRSSASARNALVERWLRDAKRENKVAITAEEEPRERWLHPTAWRFRLHFPVDDEDDIGAFETLLGHWCEGDIAMDIDLLTHIAHDVESLPTDMAEVRKLACVEDVHSH